MKIRYLSSKRYHRTTITDAFDTFEHGETTVSHVFRRRHPFLRNRSFGEAFFHAVRKYCRMSTFRNILEIGGGRGDFARDFIKAWTKTDTGGAKSYTILDLSSALLRSQKDIVARSQAGVRFVQTDVEHLPLRSGGFNGLVIANEMIADLDAWEIIGKADENGPKKIRMGKIGPRHCAGKRNAHFSPTLVRQYLRRYGGEPLLEHRSTIFPFGLALLLEELSRVVREGSTIVMTEYVDLDGGGSVIKLRKHSECKLSLTLVCHLARQMGFGIRTMSLADFLDLRITVPVATRPFLLLARDELGYDLSVTLPYGMEQLHRLLGISGNSSCDGFFSRANLQHFVTDFHVLILQERRKLSRTDFHEH
ncbi:MAG: class I SAM-dependent methyltransferase, partial [Nitrospirae bacterium]|nr:class I SAM-dependent methyltransferase [Nitrospirota bacterium]